MKSVLTSQWAKVVVFVLCLVPLGVLVWRGFHHDLTLNPVEFVEHTTGDWTLRFLVITLAISPLRKILHLPQLIRFRRMLGLFAFFYVCLHFTAYITIDQYFDWAAILKDIHKRPFITVGFTGFVLLIPLAVTSTAGWIRRLGGRRWRLLHRAIYLTAVLGVIHYYWLVKSDVSKPIEYASMVGILLAWRMAEWMHERRRRLASGVVRSKESASAETA